MNSTTHALASRRNCITEHFRSKGSPTDNFRVDAAVVQKFGETLARFGTEYLLPGGANNIALFAQGDFGADNSVRGGIRIYFGAPGKSLKDRHRQDDPGQQIPEFFGTQLPSSPSVVTPPSCEVDSFLCD